MKVQVLLSSLLLCPSSFSETVNESKVHKHVHAWLGYTLSSIFCDWCLLLSYLINHHVPIKIKIKKHIFIMKVLYLPFFFI